MPSTPNLVLCEIGETGISGLESFSPFCLKVHRALKHLGLPYTSRHGAHPGAFKATNPAGQVPVLLVDHAPVSDSTEILKRLEKVGSHPLFEVGDGRTRGEIALWEEFGDTCLYGFVLAARWADPRNWPAFRDRIFRAMPPPVRALVPALLRRGVIKNVIARDVWRAGPEACWKRFGSLLDSLNDRAPAQGFWMGDTLCAADLSLFAQLHSLRIELTPWQAEEVGRRSALSQYLNRVDERTRAAANTSSA